MQNPSHKSIYSLYQNCSTLHKGTGKIGFTFLRFSLNLYAIYKFQAKHKEKEESYYTPAPGTFQNLTKMPLDLTNRPSGENTFTEQPPTAEGSSPSAMWAWGWQTNDPDA
jgi:hypothetical protein